MSLDDWGRDPDGPFGASAGGDPTAPGAGSDLPRPASPPPPAADHHGMPQYPPYDWPVGAYPPGTLPPPMGFPDQTPAAPYQPAGQYTSGNDGKAVASLVLGILGFVCFGPFCHIPAIILGHLARRDIRRSQGRLGGDGMAIAGLILGYVGLGLMVAYMIFVVALVGVGR
jgi:Domain of unknown function (DUF4190)